MAKNYSVSAEALRRTLESEPWTTYFCQQRKPSKGIRSPGSPVVSSSLCNLLAFTSEKVIFWSATENAVILSGLKEHELQHTAIIECDVDPLSDVNTIVPSPAGCSVALIGNRGVCILDIGSGATTPSSGRFMGRCIPIAERFFLNNPKLTVVQFQWLPPRETHVAVLTSDNFLRIFKLSKPAQPELAVPLHGDVAKRSLHNFSAFTVVLSDDQDMENSHSSPKEYRGSCTVFALRSDGNVYTCDLSVGNERIVASAVRGPLNAEAPFGSDILQLATSIAHISADLPVLVISTNTSKVYHGILLEKDDTELDAEMSPVINMPTASDSELIFVERLELSNSGTSLAKKRTPSRIVIDPSFPSCYILANSSQLVGVGLPWLSDLPLLVNGGSDMNNLQPSAVKTVISLDPFDTTSEIRLLGAQLLVVDTTECFLVSVASNGQVTAQGIAHRNMIRNRAKLDRMEFNTDPDMSMAKSRGSAVPFGDVIANILRRDASMPVFTFADPEKVTGTELDALVRQAVKVYEEQYLAKQRQVCEEILARKRWLETRKKQLAHLLETMEENVEGRKNEFDDFSNESFLMEVEGERLQDGISSLQEVFSGINPTLTDAEKELEDNLHNMASKISSLEELTDTVQQKLAYQQKVTGGRQSLDQRGNTENSLLTAEICRIESLKRRVGFLRTKLDM